MRRFFLGKNRFDNGQAVIEGDLFRHLVTVLRMKVGSQFILADEEGAEYHATIAHIYADRVIVTASPCAEDLPRPGLAITLYQGIPKGDKMELILQKGTELGITAFAPFIAERSVSRPQADKLVEKQVRWERIAAEAARQSRARQMPHVASITDLPTIIGEASQALKLLLWEEETHRHLCDVIKETAAPPADIALLIGPEGGFTAREARAAIDAGFVPVTLGARILRTETAGFAAVAILQYQWGDLG